MAAEADNAGQAIELVAKQKFDLALLDISLPDKNGLELIKDLRALQPELPILVVSMHDELIYAERVLRAGGARLHHETGGRGKISAGHPPGAGAARFMSAKKCRRASWKFFPAASPSPASPVRALSDREFEVFQLVGQGEGTREIAARLHLSVKTVEVHRANIKAKLDSKRRPNWSAMPSAGWTSQGAGIDAWPASRRKLVGAGHSPATNIMEMICQIREVSDREHVIFSLH